MKVVPVLVSADNYAYLLIDEPTKKAAIVDVFNVEKVQAVADQEGVNIVAGITTHHHQDHSGGNKVCSKNMFPPSQLSASDVFVPLAY